MSLKDDVLALIRERDHVTFVELSKLPGFEGELAMTIHDDNLILWHKVSREAVDALSELWKAKLIHARPTELLTYIIDGQVPGLPRALRPPPGGYKEPHWLPVCWRPGPTPREGGLK